MEYADAFSDEFGEATTAEDESTGIEHNTCAGADKDGGVIDGSIDMAAGVDEKQVGEDMSADEAAEQLAIPAEPQKRTTGNQVTDTYYYYQGTKKLSYP